MKRESGILMHVSSLPGKYGIGAFSAEAKAFVDFLADAKQSYWQVLPLCPTSYGDSPYQSPSAFAGNPYFIDLDTLCAEGLLTKEELVAEKEPDKKVDYGKLFNTRFKCLRKAFSRFLGGEEYDSFKSENADWLNDFALFMSIKETQNYKPLADWEEKLKLRDERTLADFSAKHERDIEFWRFLQYEFFKQFAHLKAYANSRGVKIIGDMPIYVALDSADVWANGENFQMGKDLRPLKVAGVPPDAFSADGQLWGNPLYDWDYMKNDGYGFWKRRLLAANKLYDLVRIDHFRGFESYYAIPFSSKTAMEGEWVKGGGAEFFEELKKDVDVSNIIAEDLGLLTEDVREMLSKCGYPGMKVLQFGFDTDEDDEYLPKQYVENCIAYTGTHDNETSCQFYNRMTTKQKKLLAEISKNCAESEPVYKMIELVMQSKAKIAVIPVQDYLLEGEEARMNFPSKVGGYWSYRVNAAALNDSLSKRIAKITKESGRA